MRSTLLRCALALAVVFCAAASSRAEETFRWVDFHSNPAQPSKDQDIVIWVTHALEGQKWTAIREIGVMYDAALVVTTERSAPDASPATDTFNIWSISLTNHLVTAMLKGVNLRWLDSLRLAPAAPGEPTAMYDDCTECAATTYFTTFHYDTRQHVFVARWMRGAQTVPVWTTSAPAGVTLTQVYAVLPAVDGSEFLSTWNHFDYGKQKPAEDYIYRYDRDPFTNLDRVQMLSGKDGAAMKDRLCNAQVTNPTLARGQDDPLCQQMAHPHADRRPVTTPPANNQGRSMPPGAKVR